MNNMERYNEDPLRKYINPEKIEKAPVEFTSKVMQAVQKETTTALSARKLRKRSLIPVISVSVTLILILAAILIPVNESNSIGLPVLSHLNSVKITLPEIDFSFLFRSKLPSTVIYVFAGILTLSFFDRALDIFFHREN